MAFKFKVKKSPNPLQSAVAGFAGGFGQGFQKGANVQLQQMLKDREDKKNASVKEMNTFNNIISGLPQTPSNRSDILTARLSITNGSATAVEAVEVLSLGGIDFQTEKELGQSIETQSTQLDPVVATQESSAMEQAGMQGSIPTPLEVEQRTSEARQNIGLDQPAKDSSRPTRQDANKRLRYLDTGELVFPNVKPTDNKKVKIRLKQLNSDIEQLNGQLFMLSLNEDETKITPIEAAITAKQSEIDKLTQIIGQESDFTDDDPMKLFEQ